MKSFKTIKKHLRILRQEIDASSDPVFTRIAYEIETAVRWATEDVVGWSGLLQQAHDSTHLLKQEILQEEEKT